MVMITKKDAEQYLRDKRNFEVEDKVCILIDQLKDNFRIWADSCGVGQKQVDEFNTGFDVRTGNKYIKIINRGGVWGFICLYDDHKFKRGDVLKAASYNQPARNFARGNLFKRGSYRANWSGA